MSFSGVVPEFRYAQLSDTGANWTANNPVLAEGEIGYESDTCRIKIGDGTSDWNTLPYKFESISETITTFTESPAGVFTYTSEDGTITVVDTNLFATAADLTALQAIVAGNTTNITANSTAITTNTAGIAANLAATIANAANIATNSADITALQTEIDTLLENAVFNTGTNILTFTREDGTTFDVDLSSLAGGGGSTPWTTIAAGIAYLAGLVGIDTSNPIYNFQIGQHDNDAPVPDPRLLNAQVAIYGGTATNNGTATLGLYESVPSAFPGDYGYRIRYDASTNLLEFVSVVAGVETVQFSFDRATGVATYIGNIIASDPNAANHVTTRGFEDLFRDSVKVRNTATGNLNTGVATFNNFTTTDELGSTLGQFTFATNGITPNFTGVVEIHFNIELIGAATRATPGFRWLHNGANGPWARNTYIRNAAGHTETSASFSTQIPVTAGQPIQIQHDSFAGGGTVTSPANGVEFVVQRIR